MKNFEWYFFKPIRKIERKKEIILIPNDDQGKFSKTQEYGNYK